MDILMEDTEEKKSGGFGFLFILAVIVTAMMGLGFQTVQHDMRLSQALGSLNAGFDMAREEAMRRGKPVVISALDGEVIENQWRRGWVVWVDENLNGRRDGHEALRTEIMPTSGAILSSATRNTDFRYQPSGQINSTGVLKLCDSQAGQNRGHRISVSAIGNLVIADTLCT